MTEPTPDQAAADQAQADADLSAAEQEEIIAADETDVVDAQAQLDADEGVPTSSSTPDGSSSGAAGSEPGPTDPTAPATTDSSPESVPGSSSPGSDTAEPVVVPAATIDPSAALSGAVTPVSEPAVLIPDGSSGFVPAPVEAHPDEVARVQAIQDAGIPPVSPPSPEEVAATVDTTPAEQPTEAVDQASS